MNVAIERLSGLQQHTVRDRQPPHIPLPTPEHRQV